MQQKYNIVASKDYTEFEFVSVGPKGAINKLVQFSKIDDLFYSLSFGNKEENGGIDYFSIDNNKDKAKILDTVIASIYSFTQHYPNGYIVFNGSTPARTRLYRMIITLKLNELSKDFLIYGLLLQNTYRPERFEPNREYDGFMIKRK